MESAIANPKAVTRPANEHGDGTLVAAARSIEAKSHEVVEKLVHAKDQVATKSVGQMVDDGRNVIRQNPVNAILISAGIGMLIGVALGRRRS